MSPSTASLTRMRLGSFVGSRASRRTITARGNVKHSRNSSGTGTRWSAFGVCGYAMLGSCSCEQRVGKRACAVLRRKLWASKAVRGSWEREACTVGAVFVVQLS